MPVCEGYFLGSRLSGDFSLSHGTPGPAENLWLDYSQVTGALNQMQVSEPGGHANVCISWAIFHDDTATEPRILWRVSVKATKNITPFGPIVRAAAQQEQYDLHLSPDNAKKRLSPDLQLTTDQLLELPCLIELIIDVFRPKATKEVRAKESSQ